MSPTLSQLRAIKTELALIALEFAWMSDVMAERMAGSTPVPPLPPLPAATLASTVAIFYLFAVIYWLLKIERKALLPRLFVLVWILTVFA